MRDRLELNSGLLCGRQVRLVAEDAARAAVPYVRWAQDGEYVRLLEGDPPLPLSTRAVRLQAEHDWPASDPCNIMFNIRKIEDDCLIGFANLDYISWTNGDAYMGIGLGERSDRGRGCGADALGVLLRYAFTELNLFRVTLTVFEFNQRAINLYLKAGFRVEGCHREGLYREGRRWDVIEMGMLCDEWRARNDHGPASA